jgi:hypothetical protein
VDRIDIIIAPHHLDVSLPEADSQDILPLVALRSLLLRHQLTLLGFSSTFLCLEIYKEKKQLLLFNQTQTSVEQFHVFSKKV